MRSLLSVGKLSLSGGGELREPGISAGAPPSIGPISRGQYPKMAVHPLTMQITLDNQILFL